MSTVGLGRSETWQDGAEVLLVCGAHVHSIYARVLEDVRPEDMRDDVSGVLVRSDKLVCHEPREGGRRKV